MCFRKQIFRRFSLDLIFRYSKLLIICCGFNVQISENLFMYVVSDSKGRNYYWILWSRIDAKNPVFVTVSRTSFFSVSFFCRRIKFRWTDPKFVLLTQISYNFILFCRIVLHSLHLRRYISLLRCLLRIN